FGVKGDVTKENAFDFLKALSAFISSIGYKGLVILIDEVEFTMQLPMTKLRTTALDYMRYIYDECNANQFENTLFVLAGTNDFFEDTEKGIPSYKALDQRIRNDFEYDGYKDIRSSIIKLDGFGRDEMLELTQNIFKVYSNVYGKEVINKFNGVIEDIIQFYKEKSMLTGTVQPRDYVKGLVTALDIVQQNPDKFASKNEVLDLFDNLEWVKFEDDLEGIID
ncbi:MAG: BREX system ATP-binding domain-containing protein, partial [Methanobacterium sp.]